MDLAERKKYVNLVSDVKGYGGTVRIFSSLHVSGEKVNIIIYNYYFIGSLRSLIICVFSARAVNGGSGYTEVPPAGARRPGSGL